MRQEKIPTEKSITREPFPASKKVYVKGKLHDIKVAMREISLTDTSNKFSTAKASEKNPSVVVYDTSGPYTDTEAVIDVKKGLPRLREEWILKRGDVQQLSDVTSEFGKERLYNSDLTHLRFEHIKNPLKAKDGLN